MKMLVHFKNVLKHSSDIILYKLPFTGEIILSTK